MSLLENASVLRVRQALTANGVDDGVIELAATARSAQEAATALGCPLGAIVKSLVFASAGRAVMALVAGDRRCDTDALRSSLGLASRVQRADADLVRMATGFAIGGVAPVGYPVPLPTSIDASLGRFEVIWAAAGHPYCVFPTTADELVRLTGGVLSPAIGR